MNLDLFNINSIRILAFKSIQANIDLLHMPFIDLFNINSIQIPRFRNMQANIDLLHIHYINLLSF